MFKQRARKGLVGPAIVEPTDVPPVVVKKRKVVMDSEEEEEQEQERVEPDEDTFSD